MQKNTMKALASIALFVGLLAAVPAQADDDYDACIRNSDDSNVAWGACGNEWIERADAALNAAWKQLRAAASEQAGKLLVEEQRAWNAYREKSCLFYASGEYGREGQVLSYPACRAGVIEARTAEIEAHLEQMQQ